VRRIALLLLALAAAFGAVTWYALEGQEVVVLRTRAPDGGFQETRVWIADADGFSFIEAATPDRPWYQSVRMYPEVEVVRAGQARRYRAVPEPGSVGKARIRSLLRAKYGWADWWVGLIQDTSDSILVRLEPLDAPSPPPG
jgi:hypothetical protein